VNLVGDTTALEPPKTSQPNALALADNQDKAGSDLPTGHRPHPKHNSPTPFFWKKFGYFRSVAGPSPLHLLFFSSWTCAQRSSSTSVAWVDCCSSSVTKGAIKFTMMSISNRQVQEQPKSREPRSPKGLSGGEADSRGCHIPSRSPRSSIFEAGGNHDLIYIFSYDWSSVVACSVSTIEFVVHVIAPCSHAEMRVSPRVHQVSGIPSDVDGWSGLLRVFVRCIAVTRCPLWGYFPSSAGTGSGLQMSSLRS